MKLIRIGISYHLLEIDPAVAGLRVDDGWIKKAWFLRMELDANHIWISLMFNGFNDLPIHGGR